MGDSLFAEAVVRDARMMCRRDRNHPSVVMWEASLNETLMPIPFLNRLHLAVKEELPYGNNATCSWMDTICDIFTPARQHAEAPGYWKDYRKAKPLFISVYGDWEYYTQDAGIDQKEFSDPGSSERTSRQTRGDGDRRMLQQALNFQEAHNDNLYGPCIGDANWLMYDYNRGNAPDLETSGIMDIFRLPKFAYWFYRSQHDHGPVCFIAHHNLPESGNMVRVFSNADSIQLFRNDSLIAVQGPDIDSASLNLLHPPFTFTLPDYVPGTIKANALRNGTVIVSHTVSTPGKPVALRLSADLSNKPLRGDNSDAVFVYATLIDSAGNQAHTADSLVEFTVRGNAEVIGANPVRAEAGIASILLRSGSPGRVMIKASSEGMSEAELMTESR